MHNATSGILTSIASQFVRLVFVLLVLAALGIATACSSSVRIDGEDQAQRRAQESDQAVAPQSAEPVTLDELQQGPVWDIVNYLSQPDSEGLTPADHYSIAVGERVVDCMAAQGHDYVNVLWSNLRVPPEVRSLAASERMAVAGYDITTHIDYWYSAGLNNPVANPNTELLASVSEEDQRMWEVALFGQFGSGGCLGTSFAETVWDIDIAQFERDVALLEREINAHRTVREATKRWSACMAEAEYVYSTRAAERPRRPASRVALGR